MHSQSAFTDPAQLRVQLKCTCNILHIICLFRSFCYLGYRGGWHDDNYRIYVCIRLRFSKLITYLEVELFLFSVSDKAMCSVELRRLTQYNTYNIKYLYYNTGESMKLNKIH